MHNQNYNDLPEATLWGGNSDPEMVGRSNKGREIMAGNGPTRVVYITQQHGNEYVETEAAFDFLRA